MGDGEGFGKTGEYWEYWEDWEFWEIPTIPKESNLWPNTTVGYRFVPAHKGASHSRQPTAIQIKDSFGIVGIS